MKNTKKGYIMTLKTLALLDGLSADDQKLFEKINKNIKSGILHYHFNTIDELQKCIRLKFYPNKMANFIYENYRYDIINCRNIEMIKMYCENAFIEMVKLAKNKVELRHTKKGQYGPNALKNCVSKNMLLQHHEKELMYNYIDLITK